MFCGEAFCGMRLLSSGFNHDNIVVSCEGTKYGWWVELGSPNDTTMHLSVVTRVISQYQKVNVVVACAVVSGTTPTYGRREVNTCC